MFNNNDIDTLYLLTHLMEQMSEHEKYLPTMARTYKKLYDELLNVGFEKEQAILIVSNMKVTGH